MGASSRADKDMIDALVVGEMGSFDRLNQYLRHSIETVLEKAQISCSQEFTQLFSTLSSQSKAQNLQAQSSSASGPQTVAIDIEEEPAALPRMPAPVLLGSETRLFL